LTPGAAGGAQYTAYMYMEDDTLVPWRAMTAWARATPALDERNLTFGFYRTEVSPDTGELVMLDLSIRVNTSTAPTAHIEGVGHFVELPQPYFGMWLASHQKLKAFMAHPFWEKKNALAANAPHGGGYPERTTWMIQYLNVPPGHLTQSVIQYDPVTNTLDPNARVAHLRNGYSANVHQPLGKLPLMLALDR